MVHFFPIETQIYKKKKKFTAYSYKCNADISTRGCKIRLPIVGNVFKNIKKNPTTRNVPVARCVEFFFFSNDIAKTFIKYRAGIFT